MASAPKKVTKVVTPELKPKSNRKGTGTGKFFNGLTEKDINFIKKTYFNKSKKWNERMSILMEYTGVGERVVRKWLAKLEISGEGVEPEEYTKAKKRKLDKSKSRFIITYCQNNTPVNAPFWENIKAYAKFIDADIHVILGRYKNPTSVFQDSDKEFWSPEVIPYADANRHNVHKNLSILSDIKVQPTAVMPLSGLESITFGESCVIGSPKCQMKVCPTLRTYEPKIMMSTGAVSLENYTDSKAGKKGEFHHVFGFVIVEVKDKDTYFMRQVTANKKGNFIDLWNNVEDGKITRAKEACGFIVADKHVGDHCEVVDIQQRKIMDIVKPKYSVWHDIFNGKSVNNHVLNDVITQYQLEMSNENNLQNEIDNMLKYLESVVKYNPVIVASNHNDWLDRVVRKGELIKSGIKNFATLNKLTQVSPEGKANKGLIAHIIDEHFKGKIKTLGYNESFKIGGKNPYECAQHSNYGANGSRGSANSFRSVTKYCLGHTHTPLRLEGVLYAGTSTRLDLDYTNGLSSWLNADILINSDTKAQHIIYLGKNKEFTTFKFPKK